MAGVHPFRAFRYDSQAGPLSNLVTQPYDKISPAMQERYLGLSPYNLVRLILGPRFNTDTEGDNVYTRAASYLREWISSGVLVQDPEPAFYAYFQEFRVPESGEWCVRKGFVGLGPVVDYSEGIVHRHEQTLAGPKKDRLELLAHTHAHFGQIFMLYPDPAGAIDQLLDEAAQAPPLMAVADEYEALHRVWRISDPRAIGCIQELMADKKLLIADGHHRYETALAFAHAHPEMADARRVMMTFVNLHSPGLRILATHRLVRGLAAFEAGEFLERARALFEVLPLSSLAELKARWAEQHKDRVRIGAVLTGEGHPYLLERERVASELHVEVLHHVLLNGVLGIDEQAVREERHLGYLRGVEAAAAEVRAGRAQAAFLLEPARIEEVARIAFGGGVMPQKSTDFYPKLLSGLVAYKLEK